MEQILSQKDLKSFHKNGFILVKNLFTRDEISKLMGHIDDLKALEAEIRRAERPPFENWYRKSWIRNDDSPYNVHRSYERTLAFVIANYLKP